jgi:anti-sigma-K factor RskA
MDRRMGLTHDEMKDLLAAYVLGALPEEEHRVVQAHVWECEECAEEAEGYIQAADTLAAAVPHEPLPPGFADAVVARVSAEREPQAVAPARRGWRYVLATLTAIASVAAIVLGVLLIDARSDLATNEEVLAAIIESDAGIALQGQEGAVARVVPTARGSSLVVANLNSPPESKTYELWFLPGRPEPISAGTFEPSDDVFVFETELSIEDFDGAAVTIEPDGGSPKPGPTGDFVLTST